MTFVNGPAERLDDQALSILSEVADQRQAYLDCFDVNEPKEAYTFYHAVASENIHRALKKGDLETVRAEALKAAASMLGFIEALDDETASQELKQAG